LEEIWLCIMSSDSIPKAVPFRVPES
jgi:hypothetical protein